MEIASKLARLVAALFAISVLTFLLTQLLPGDPACQVLGPRCSDKVALANVQHDLHIDKPLPVQYEKWLGGVLHGDLGRAYSNNQRVSQILSQRLPVTLELLVLAQLLALIVAVPIAVYSAYRQDGVFDRSVTTASFGVLSIPDFVLAVFLVFLLAVKFHAFPATGFTHLSDSVSQNLRSMFLPSVSLALPLAAVYIRLLRSDMITTLREDYILMARAEGLPPRRILFRHALRPSSFSLLTVFGINMGALIGGALIIEFLFALPGVGLKLVDSIFRRDYLVVQGFVLVIATGYVLVNFLVDLLYTVLDPRTRHVKATV
jgi:peptide/nickel transport system permease protein